MNDEGISRESEREVVRTRLHGMSFVRDAFAIVLIGLGPLFISPLFAESPLGEAAGPYAALIPVAGFVWVFIAWVVLWTVWTNYLSSELVITDRRVVQVVQAALLSRSARAWRLDSIEKVSVDKRGLLQTMFGYGTLVLHTKSNSLPDTIEDVPAPERVRNLLFEHVASITTLSAANADQEKLLHTISHEVKAHLTKNAAALASIVEGDYDGTPEQLKKIAGEALVETRKGVSMVTDLLNASNFRTGALTFEHKRLDLKEVVASVVSELQPDAKRKNIALEYIAPESGYEIQGDEQKLREHVIRNLLDNAIHYTPQGLVRVALARVEGFVVLMVADTGIGMAESDRARLFTEGGKGERSTEANPSSTGYGLFIAKSVVDAHRGLLWAHSAGPGFGSQFYACFPAAPHSIA